MVQTVNGKDKPLLYTHTPTHYYRLYAYISFPLFSFGRIVDEKNVWDLPESLAHEVGSVEELLRRGGCDIPNGRLIVQVKADVFLLINSPSGVGAIQNCTHMLLTPFPVL